MQFDAEFYVALGFVIFVVMMASAGVHKKIASALDGHIGKIEVELTQARRLREEAEAVLTSYRHRATEAEQEAAAIVAQAKTDADLIAKEAATRLADYIARRTKQAEEKIVQAEAQATADVRAAAADAAVKAAEIILRKQVADGFGADLVSQGIGDVKRLAS